MKHSLSLLIAATLSLPLAACSKKEATPAPAPAAPPAAERPVADEPIRPAVEARRVFFTFPQDGATVFTTFDVGMGAQGMGIRPAGEDVSDKASGHHHLIVDGGPVPAGEVVPKDATHIHYGKGETETALTLTPGDHTVTMQLADGAHLSYGPELSQTIKVHVVEGGDNRAVSFVEPKDGATVRSPLKVVFGLTGMKVRPAGEDPLDGTTGHHHLIIDGEPAFLGQVVGKDDTHIHYGKGETEAEITLAPGPHTLTLQLADGAHRAYGSRLTSTIHVTVQ